MSTEDKNKKKSVSRKWKVTVWAMTVGTVIIIISGFCAFTGKDIPDGFTGRDSKVLGLLNGLDAFLLPLLRGKRFDPQHINNI
mgnify:CR=1 FL=1